MIKIKLLFLVMILMGPCALIYARRTIPAGRTLAAALCAQSLFLILWGYLLPFSAGVGLLALLSAGGWLYALIQVFRRKAFRQAICDLLIPCAVLAGAAIFLYDVCAARLFLSYDEHSHWGMIVKAIDLFDELPRAGRGAPYIQFTYPPSAAMLSAMAASVLGYRDGIAYLGYILLIFGLMWGLAHRVSRGRWPITLMTGTVLYLVMMAIFPLGMMRLFTEPVIALLMALLILGGQENTKPNLWEDGLYALMLAMIKNTGLVFVLLALIVRLAMRRNKKAALKDAGILLGCVLAVASYSAYCRAQGIGAVMSPSHLHENLQALLAGTLHEDYRSLPVRYLSFLFMHPLSQAGIYTCYGFGTCVTVLLFVGLMSLAHRMTAKDTQQASRLWRGLWLVNAAYMVMIVASYFFNFEPWEVARLSEADRYTMLIALWTGVTACAMLMSECGTMHKKRWMLLLGVIVAALLPLSHMEMTVKTFITRDYIHNTVWARDMTDRMTAYVKSQLPAGEAKLLCMGESQYVEMHYTLAGHTDLGPVTQDWKKSAWGGDPDAVVRELEQGGYTHVLVCGLDVTDINFDEATREMLSIDARYDALTADGMPLKAYSLYGVERAEDGVKLSYLSTMPEQEQ